jgi:transposase InsO family protein
VAAIQDVFSRRIVGWGMADHMRSELVVDALQMALGRRRPAPGLIHHSDQGSQFVWLAFGQAARAAGIAQSMGSRGDCYDNAVAESFFATSSKSSSTAARGRRRRSCEPRCSTPSRSSSTASAATARSACASPADLETSTPSPRGADLAASRLASTQTIRITAPTALAVP